MAKPDNNSDVVAVAFNLALDMCNLLQERPSGEVVETLRRFILSSSSIKHLQLLWKLSVLPLNVNCFECGWKIGKLGD